MLEGMEEGVKDVAEGFREGSFSFMKLNVVVRGLGFGGRLLLNEDMVF